jgi:hypothetical protein
MSVHDSNDTDFVFLYNSGSKAVTLYAGNETAVAPKNGLPSILIRFKTNIAVVVLGYVPQDSCVKIKMKPGSNGFMELISLEDFHAAYREKNPRHVFKQILPR